MHIKVVDLGFMEYMQALDLQERLKYLRSLDKIEDTLLIVEHNPVLTLGSTGSIENILVSKSFLEKQNVDLVKLSRGGDVTYHGPGQIVGYPIFHLKNYNRDVRAFIWKIKETFIQLLKKEYQIEAIGLEKEYTGVWVNDKKITAIGLSISRSVSMHGFAFNVNTNLEHFKWINPCGFKDRGVTSLEKILGKKVDMKKLKEQTIDYFCKLFEVNPNYISVNDLLKMIEVKENEL